jgi:hypothetical protein
MSKSVSSFEKCEYLAILPLPLPLLLSVVQVCGCSLFVDAAVDVLLLLLLATCCCRGQRCCSLTLLHVFNVCERGAVLSLLVFTDLVGQ